MTIAYWISPDGEIIEVKRGSHIAEVIANPKKFGFTREFIEFIHTHYDERLGLEGKARRQLMRVLFDNNWIRIRQYKHLWSINVKKDEGKLNSYLNQWARKIIKGLHGFIEKDPYVSINIDQKNRDPKTVELKSMAVDRTFIPAHMLIEKTIEELPNIKPYNFISQVKQNQC